MIKVHAIGECYNLNQIGDVAHIRLFLPLQILADEKQILLTKDISYNEYLDSDIFFIQRTWSYNKNVKDVEYLIKTKYYNNIKLIYEIDDNLLDNVNIPSESKKVIYLLVKLADMVIVSTQELKKRLINLNNKITVISNFLDSKLIEERKNSIKNKGKIITIGYMGTYTHQLDFQMIKLPLIKVLKKYQSKVKLEILRALNDESIIKSIPNIEIKKCINITDYFTFWEWMNKNCFWDIGIAPLKYSEFTKCKSDIKYLDYSALGIAGIYSKHPAYNDTITNNENGLIVENNCDAWQEALEELITNENLRSKIKMNAHKDLWDNRLLQNNSYKWLEVINYVITLEKEESYFINNNKKKDNIIPLISIIIPVYNAEKYLECCIDSILSQTMCDFELLLIDDCSKDKSLEICNNYARYDKRIKVYHKNKNEGVAFARKTGVENVNTEYILFIDNDDWIENTMFEELYNKIKSDNYDMVCCDFYHEYENEQIYAKQDPENNNNIELMKQIIYWGDFYPVTWNKLIKKELFKKITFSEISYSEDRGIMVQILFYANKIGYVNKAFYHWRHINSSLSRKKENLMKNLYEDYICYVNILCFLINNGLDANEYLEYVNAHFEIIGKMYSLNIKTFKIFKISYEKIIKWYKKNKISEEMLSNEKISVKRKFNKKCILNKRD